MDSAICSCCDNFSIYTCINSLFVMIQYTMDIIALFLEGKNGILTFEKIDKVIVKGIKDKPKSFKVPYKKVDFTLNQILHLSILKIRL